MSTVLSELLNKFYWEYILEKKKIFLPKGRLKVYLDILQDNKYLKIAREVISGNYQFLPLKQFLINRQFKEKRKIVFQQASQDEFLCRVLQYILNLNFSSQISKCCYSFRLKKGIKEALNYLLRKSRKLKNLYCVKLDISNYFNSIPIDKFLETLPPLIKKDFRLTRFIADYFNNSKIKADELIMPLKNKGVMAGTPLAPFFSNIYLKELDDVIFNEPAIYCRYADDLIIFIEENKKDVLFLKIKNILKEKGLTLNLQKTKFIHPTNTWEFLGFIYQNNKIAISPYKVKKIKAKIKRLIRKYKRKIKKNKENLDLVVIECVKKINKKFYSSRLEDDFSWARWYFPIINDVAALKTIDIYIQDRLRYLIIGKNIKSNYKKVPYTYLTSQGYIPLVRAYWTYKKDFDKYLEKISSLN